MLKQLALAAPLMLLPAAAQAGSFVDGVYTSNLGYTVRPPSNWVRLDASNASAMLGHIPKNIDRLGTNRFDVIFFPAYSKVDTSLDADTARMEKNKETLKNNKNADSSEIIPPVTDSSTPSEFSPMASIIVIDGVPSKVSAEMAKVYGEKFKEKITSKMSYTDFKLKVATLNDSLKAGNAYEFSANFIHNSHDIAVEQTMIFFSNETMIVTCVYDDNDNNLSKNWCQSMIGSITKN